MTVVHTAWTWWIPYLGVFILGWALRGIVLRGPALVAAAATTAALVPLGVWQWRNPAAPDWLQTIAPVNYYGPTVTLLTVLVFLLGQAARPRHPSHGELGQRRPRIVHELGAATLGVFALHVAILQLVIEWEWFGPGATTAPLLLLRYAAVLALTVVIVLSLRRVPYVRAVL